MNMTRIDFGHEMDNDFRRDYIERIWASIFPHKTRMRTRMT